MGNEESSLLALRSVSEHNSSLEATSRRRKPPVTCTNDDGVQFSCAGGDRCCGGACVGENDVCCENVNGDSFPCHGQGGGCCGNACYAPGSKCCKPHGPKCGWYPVSEATECRAKCDVCCENVLGNKSPLVPGH